MIVKLYRKYVSQNVRDRIYDAFLGYFLLFVRNFRKSIKSLFIYVFRRFLPDTEANRLYAFMGKYGVIQIPYEFTLKYKKIPVGCFYDDQQEMYYVIHQNKKLYFPSTLDKRGTINCYKSLIVEQDILSPHRYLEDLSRLTGKTVLDIGAAEGIFSLDAIEFAAHVYLFECDEIWIKALKATFAPWSEKVTIIAKYVSDINNDTHTTIDRFLEGKDKSNLFLKMDIEGYEQVALRGAANTLREAKDLDYSVCTYHFANDAEEIEKIFSDNQFQSEFTNGFFYMDDCFRTAIIRRKTN